MASTLNEKLSVEFMSRVIPSASQSALTMLRRRVHVLQRLVPIGLVLFVVLYEVGPADWIHTQLGNNYHVLAEILVYGALGPLLAYLLLHFLDRWLEERETSELQSQLLAQERLRAKISRELTDDALQTLFAASVLMTSLKSALGEVPPQTADALRDTEAAVDRAIQQLRDHLQT